MKEKTKNVVRRFTEQKPVIVYGIVSSEGVYVHSNPIKVVGIWSKLGRKQDSKKMFTCTVTACRRITTSISSEGNLNTKGAFYIEKIEEAVYEHLFGKRKLRINGVLPRFQQEPVSVG